MEMYSFLTNPRDICHSLDQDLEIEQRECDSQ